MKKSLISAVKKLLAKLGASEVEGNNLVEVIDSGAEALVEAGDGNEVIYMATINAQNEITIETDYQTIKADINDGKNVKILATHTASVRTFVMELQTFDNTVVTFCSMYPSQQGASYGISIYYLSMNETGTNTFGIKSVS